MSNPWVHYNANQLPAVTYKDANKVSTQYSAGDGPVVPQEVAVTAVTAINDINVANGTALANIGLPATVEVTKADSTKANLAVTWDGGTPAYSATTAGTYTFSGTITLPAGVTNPNNLKASVKVIVAAPVLTVSSVSAINGTVTVTLSDNAPANVAIADFAVTQSINGAAATTVTPTNIAANGKVVTLTVPQVAAADAAQSVVMSISYKGGTAVSATAFTVAAKPLAIQSVSVLSATSLKATLATPTLDKTASDFAVKINGDDVTPSAAAADATGANYTLTIPTLAGKEGNITVNGVSPANKVAAGSDFDFDYKVPSATVTVVDASHLSIVFSEKVSKTQAETIANNYLVKKVSAAGDDPAPTAAKLGTDGKTVDITLATPLVPANYVLKLNHTANANNIKDIAGNAIAVGTEVAFTGAANADVTPPQVLTAAYDSSAGQLVVTFNEAMNTATFVQSGFTVTNGTSSVVLGVNETGAWSVGNTVLTVNLSSSQKAAVNALSGSLTLAIAANSVKDAAQNGIQAVANKAITAKTVLQSATYDEATNVLSLTFSNPVNVSSFVKGEVTLDSSTGQTRALGANDAVTTTANGTVINITLKKDAALDTYEGTTVAGRNVDFSAASGNFLDTAGLAVAPTNDISLTYTKDSTAPTLTSASYNATTQRLTLVFSEPVQVDNAANAFSPVAANIAFTTGAYTISAATCEQDTADGIATSASTLTFVDVANTLTSDSKICFPTAGAFSDDAGNKLAVIAQANALTINYVDQTGPSVAGGGNATQISTTSCSITFDKKLNKTDAENIANYTIAKNDNPDVKLNVASALLDAAGTKVTLTVSTAVTNGYIYTITIKNVRDTFGNVIKSANSTATWAATASEDTTAPSLAGVAVKYTDVDSSKSITSGDTIEIFFNELMSIDFTKVTTADYAITGGRNLGASPAFQYGSGRNSVVITLGTAPTITWGDTITPAASSDFKDLAGNSATAVASGALTNPGSAPKISTISYADTNASGAVDAGDKLTIIYDRNITLPNGIAGLGATDFTLGGALNFGGSPVFELQNGNQIVVTLGGGGIAVDARTTTLDTIDEAATADIADVWGVTQLAADGTTAKVTSADRTSPSIASVAITKGTGNVGAALEANDKVTITLSEPAHKGAFTASEFALFTGATQLTYTGVTTDVAVAGNKVTITVKAGDGWVGTALSAITTFNFTTAAATVLDASGNVASPASGFGVSVTKP